MGIFNIAGHSTVGRFGGRGSSKSMFEIKDNETGQKKLVKPFEGNESSVIREVIGQRVFARIAQVTNTFSVSHGQLVIGDNGEIGFASSFIPDFKSISDASKVGKKRMEFCQLPEMLERAFIIFFLCGDDDRSKDNVTMNLEMIDFGRFGFLSGGDLSKIYQKFQNNWNGLYEPGKSRKMSYLKVKQGLDLCTSALKDVILQEIDVAVNELAQVICNEDLAEIDFPFFDLSEYSTSTKKFNNWSELAGQFKNQILFNFTNVVPHIRSEIASKCEAERISAVVSQSPIASNACSSTAIGAESTALSVLQPPIPSLLFTPPPSRSSSKRKSISVTHDVAGINLFSAFNDVVANDEGFEPADDSDDKYESPTKKQTVGIGSRLSFGASPAVSGSFMSRLLAADSNERDF